MAAFAVVAVWVCGYFVQAQTELSGLTQDMVPRESKTCRDIRYNLEMMFFNTYKATIPQQLLKQVLPGLAEPLLPPECIRSGGHGKWLLDKSATDGQQASSTPAFMPPLANTKGPGNQPPPGLLGDPMKDPVEGQVSGAGSDPLMQPFRAGFYGDKLPLGRKKRSMKAVDSAAVHMRHKRASGEEEKKGLSLDNLLFNSLAISPFGTSFFSSIDQLFAPQRRSSHSQQGEANRGRQNTYTGSQMSSSALSSPALADPLLQSPANGAAGGQANALQSAGGLVFGGQAAGGMSAYGFSPFSAPSTSVQPSVFPSQPRLTIPTQPMTPGPGGMIYGDMIPSFGASPRRVKRAIDNSSPSDVVTIGDFSMPADTFTKLVNPRGSRSDDYEYHGSRAYPPPLRYNHVAPPPPRPSFHPTNHHQPAPIYVSGPSYPFSAPFSLAQQSPQMAATGAYNMYKVRLLQASQVLQQLRNAQRGIYPPALGAVSGIGAAAPMTTLPMGAALPVFGNHAGY